MDRLSRRSLNWRGTCPVILFLLQVDHIALDSGHCRCAAEGRGVTTAHVTGPTDGGGRAAQLGRQRCATGVAARPPPQAVHARETGGGKRRHNNGQVPRDPGASSHRATGVTQCLFTPTRAKLITQRLRYEVCLRAGSSPATAVGTESSCSASQQAALAHKPTERKTQCHMRSLDRGYVQGRCTAAVTGVTRASNIGTVSVQEKECLVTPGPLSMFVCLCKKTQRNVCTPPPPPLPQVGYAVLAHLS